MGEARYRAMFERLRGEEAIAFIPFVVLGDPDPERCLAAVDAVVEAGADALELGIPFSDPVADGPTIQAANLRARAAGSTPTAAIELLGAIRARHPQLPLGLLVYANLAHEEGFYARVAAAGADSVLVADVPTREAPPFARRALAHDVAPVLIAPPNARDETLDRVAELSRGYTYVVTRRGVTGTEQEAGSDLEPLLRALRERDAAPAVLGFGISHPDHVRAARAAGAAGAISGSAVVKRIEDPAALRDFVAAMKAATGPG